jgi:putative transposase
MAEISSSPYLQRFSTRPQGQADMVATAIRTIFAQPTGPMARDQVETVALMLQPLLPAVATMLRDAKEEITAFADFPETHRVRVLGTESVNGAVEQGG